MMGISLRIHIGAYLELKFDPIPRKEIIIICQKHPDLDIQGSNKFCSLCGRKLESKIIEKTYGMDWWDLLNEGEKEKYQYELVDVLQEDESAVYLIGNKFLKGSLDSIPLLNDEYGEFEITPQMILSYKQNFSQNYKEFIDLIKPRVKTLEIKFGTIAYYD